VKYYKRNWRYSPVAGKMTVAIEKALSDEEFRSLFDIYDRAFAIDPRVSLSRVEEHCDWHVEHGKRLSVELRTD
jgi:hypothetical protein